MDAGLRRRHVLKGGAGALAGAAFAASGLAACSDGGGAAAGGPSALGFEAVPKDLADRVVVPAGYTATVVYATGDPLDAAVSDYRNDGSDGDFARRAGDHHDAMHWFGLSADGLRRDASSSDRGLLCVNHENIAGTVQFMHPGGQTNPSAGARPEAEVVKEIAAHGVSVVELARDGGRLAARRDSRYNRRVTAATPVELRGPLRGHALARTRYSPAGLMTRGTINNCASGHTPWGTYLACEENWAGYFRRAAGDDARRSARELTALRRVGLRQGAGGNFRWTSVVPSDPASTEFSRWDASVSGTSADGSDDFRNAPNTFGWVVEIDPHDPHSTPRKRTALGRFAHEGAWPGLARAGRPLAFYMGDDSRGEYVYKFVSDAAWDPADAAGGLAAGDRYLDAGTLYAARFDADGTGTWLKLDLGNPAVAGNAAYAFADLADVVANARLAADAAGATRMDRPEWTAVNPANGEVYVTLTENPDRGAAGRSGNDQPDPPPDAANPRYWLDRRTRDDGSTIDQKGNVNGHVLRLREAGDDAASTAFVWDIYLFGAQARADAGLDDAHYQRNVNLSGLDAGNDLSKPDGCWFSRATGILWIETDDNTYTDVTNCMLLAALPGRVGDGGPVTVENLPAGSPDPGVVPATTVTTRMGAKPGPARLRRFLTAPAGAEVTGLAETPDGRALFVNIQHPGEGTGSAVGAPGTSLASGVFESHWPGNGGGIAAPYGPGGAGARPRSATVMITKDDGGVIGL